MNIEIMKQSTEASFKGTMAFPEIVGLLMKEGLESYTVDLVQNTKIFYMPNGEVFNESFKFQGPAIAKDFNQEKVVEAIRLSQGKKINYTEFLNLAMKAGVTTYAVYLDGRKAIYFGRKGELHIENFPQK